MESKHLILTIDGPAGAGKSTISKLVADKLNIEYIDTGAMFRAIAYKLINENVSLEDKDKIKDVLKHTEVDFQDGKIYLDKIDVSKNIRSSDISLAASNIAKNTDVRDKLLDLQRKIASQKSLVMDGRDIGTVVLPDAKYKFFLTASVEVRALRRFNELNQKSKISIEEVTEDIVKRDYNDMNREIAPLKQANDAILIDSSNLSIDETVDKIVSYVDRR